MVCGFVVWVDGVGEACGCVGDLVDALCGVLVVDHDDHGVGP